MYGFKSVSSEGISRYLRAGAAVLRDLHHKNMQGVFHDHGHYEEGTWKGVRMVSDASGVTAGSTVTLVGSDDGKTFWMLNGKKSDGGKVLIDFSPKASSTSISNPLKALPHRASHT
jgi:hypothetical protein